MYRFPWYLTVVSTNHASSNPGQGGNLPPQTLGVYSKDIHYNVSAVYLEIRMFLSKFGSHGCVLHVMTLTYLSYSSSTGMLSQLCRFFSSCPYLRAERFHPLSRRVSVALEQSQVILFLHLYCHRNWEAPACPSESVFSFSRRLSVTHLIKVAP